MADAPRPGWIRRCYDWVLQWADHPAGPAMLFGLAVAEAVFFPVPPDVLLIALTFAAPARAWRFAAICTLGSVVGGICGYALGALAAPLGKSLLVSLVSLDAYYQVADIYSRNAFAALLVAGFTPIPYKVFAVSAGIFHEWVGLGDLIAATVLSRAARFFLVAWLIRRFGPSVRPFMERHLGVATLVVAVGVVGGFVVVAGSAGGTTGAVKLRGLVAEVAGGNPELRAEALGLLEQEGAPSAQALGLDPTRPVAKDSAGYRELRAWLEVRVGPPPPGLDTRAFRWFNRSGANGLCDGVAWLVHRNWWLIGLGLLAAALAVALGSTRMRRITLHVVLAAGLAGLGAAVMKPAVGRERPAATLQDVRLAPGVEAPSTASLPSSHAAVSGGAAAALAMAHPLAGALAGVAALTIGWARVYAGAHYPGDVLAGWVLGLACALLVGWWLGRRDPPGPDEPGSGSGSAPGEAQEHVRQFKSDDGATDVTLGGATTQPADRERPNVREDQPRMPQDARSGQGAGALRLPFHARQ